MKFECIKCKETIDTMKIGFMELNDSSIELVGRHEGGYFCINCPKCSVELAIEFELSLTSIEEVEDE